MDSRSDSAYPPNIDRERFLYRMSQIAALALILSVSAITFALINFVGLNPVVGDLEHRIDRLERTRASSAAPTEARRRTRDDRAASGAASVTATMEALDDLSRDLDPATRERMEALTREMAGLLASERTVEVSLGDDASPSGDE